MISSHYQLKTAGISETTPDTIINDNDNFFASFSPHKSSQKDLLFVQIENDDFDLSLTSLNENQNSEKVFFKENFIFISDENKQPKPKITEINGVIVELVENSKVKCLLKMEIGERESFLPFELFEEMKIEIVHGTPIKLIYKDSEDGYSKLFIEKRNVTPKLSKDDEQFLEIVNTFISKHEQS